MRDATEALTELVRRLQVEADYEGGEQGPMIDGLRAGYRDAARMARELMAES